MTPATARESRPSVPMCCRGCARCAQDIGRALTCPIHGERWTMTPPAPTARGEGTMDEGTMDEGSEGR